MTGPQYCEAIKSLGLSQVAAGKFLKASPRSSRRWTVDGPPPMPAMILMLVIKTGLSVADVERMMQ